MITCMQVFHFSKAKESGFESPLLQTPQECHKFSTRGFFPASTLSPTMTSCLIKERGITSLSVTFSATLAWLSSFLQASSRRQQELVPVLQGLVLVPVLVPEQVLDAPQWVPNLSETKSLPGGRGLNWLLQCHPLNWDMMSIDRTKNFVLHSATFKGSYFSFLLERKETKGKKKKSIFPLFLSIFRN